MNAFHTQPLLRLTVCIQGFRKGNQSPFPGSGVLVISDQYSRPSSPCRPQLWMVFYPESRSTTFNCKYRVSECSCSLKPWNSCTELCFQRIGAVLYTTYLQTLGHLHHQSSQSLKRVFPPPSFQSTFTAGFLAGGIQSVVAAPLDALSIRFKTSEVLNGRYKNMWSYGSHKLRELGPRGIFAGWTLAFLKDSLGYGAFFATFEYVKSQAYYDFVVSFYDPAVSSGTAAAHSNSSSSIIKPHYALEPTFLMLAGISASITQQIFAYPLSRIANVHFTSSLEHLDRLAARPAPLSPLLMLRGYARAYERTFARCAERAKTGGGWRRWLYKAWLVNTIKQVPSTSAGLLIFEMVRRRYGGGESAGVVEWRGREISVA